METKPLLFGLIGFFMGGLLVSVAATTFDKPNTTSEMSMTQMTEDLKDKQGDDFDQAFIANMIEHHRTAVDMAELSSDRANHQEVKDLSSAIITAQQKEINEMKKWQIQWNYDPQNTPGEKSGH